MFALQMFLIKYRMHHPESLGEVIVKPVLCVNYIVL
ncbi:hypothetical protein B6N60_02179 [Richelia sinica FACHB-800]|uniref:Uncharacterized protein n=1 Tax=Richelia sinica FACHB-800 TaxID=1357546 RepID=A0A975Y4S8_9NOST|nr:hypothetical protein B6N60_02179 [Richelia sinica FACHB-800]